jgi:hypothetical protein
MVYEGARCRRGDEIVGVLIWGAAVGVDGGGHTQQVPTAELAKPAAEPIQTLLLLLQLRQRVLADPLLLLQLGQILAAIGVELRPFRLPSLHVKLIQTGGVPCGITARGQH